MCARVFLSIILALLAPAQVGWSNHNKVTLEVIRIEPMMREGNLSIDADVEFLLNDHLREAAQRGVPLHFTADLRVTRKRWWWIDETLIECSNTWRITYNALTRQWRASADKLSFSMVSLDHAMNVVKHIRNWQIRGGSALDQSVTYTGQLRLRLNTSLLPLPFKVNAINSSAWLQATPWAFFTFSLSSLK